jgi:hypothetical protein
MLRREPKERGLVSSSPRCFGLCSKNNCPGTSYLFGVPESQNNGRNRSARRDRRTRCIRTNEGKACSLRVRAGLYWIRVNKCLNTTN